MFDWFGVNHSHGAFWNWTHTLSEDQGVPPTASSSWVAVDELQIEVGDEKKWLYFVIDTDSRLRLEIDVYSRHGTDLAVVLLHRLNEKHDVAGAKYSVVAAGYLTVLARPN